MTRHTIAFTIKHAAGSAEEISFLQDAKILAAIPGVERFDQLRQTGKKNNDHPDYTAILEDRWIPEIATIMEIDYEPLA